MKIVLWVVHWVSSDGAGLKTTGNKVAVSALKIRSTIEYHLSLHFFCKYLNCIVTTIKIVMHYLLLVCACVIVFGV